MTAFVRTTLPLPTLLPVRFVVDVANGGAERDDEGADEANFSFEPEGLFFCLCLCLGPIHA